MAGSLTLTPYRAFAQAVEVSDEDTTEESAVGQNQNVTESTEKKTSPKVGTEAARKYFKKKTTSGFKTTSAPTKSPLPTGNRYLSLQVGGFLNQDTYNWGTQKNRDVGVLNAGVTYKIGEWTGSMDLLFKGDVTTFNLEEGRAVKISFVPAITFPDAASGFPLYFGAGAGLGIFFKQISKESALSLDYTVFAGTRIYNVFKQVGLLLEAGIKNHFLLLSDGQHNGVYAAAGVVFLF